MTITEQLRADPRLVAALVARTRGAIAGVVTAAELRDYGYSVPDGYLLRAWPFENRQGHDGFLRWAQTGTGGPQPVLVNNNMTVSDWVIVGAASALLGLAGLGAAGVGPLAAASSSTGAAAATGGAATTAATTGAATTAAGAAAKLVNTGGSLVSALTTTRPPTVDNQHASAAAAPPAISSTEWAALGLVALALLFFR